MPPRLRRSDLSKPGLTRRRSGKGWTFLDADGNRITDPDTLARVRALAIPPAYKDVWISPHPYGHIQAVGTDAAGRRQYRYHELWSERRAQAKHLKVLQVGERLPTMRRRWAAREAWAAPTPMRPRSTAWSSCWRPRRLARP